jgi:hypothetical protein
MHYPDDSCFLTQDPIKPASLVERVVCAFLGRQTQEQQLREARLASRLQRMWMHFHWESVRRSWRDEMLGLIGLDAHAFAALMYPPDDRAGCFRMQVPEALRNVRLTLDHESLRASGFSELRISDLSGVLSLLSSKTPKPDWWAGFIAEHSTTEAGSRPPPG